MCLAQGAWRRAFGAWQPDYRRRVASVWSLEKNRILWPMRVYLALDKLEMALGSYSKALAIAGD